MKKTGNDILNKAQNYRPKEPNCALCAPEETLIQSSIDNPSQTDLKPWEIQASVHWNPWHGCTKISAGCLHCYVYRQDAQYGAAEKSALVHKNAQFNLPLRRGRDKSYKIKPNSIVYTCLTSDFWHQNADPWRSEAWEIIRQRQDLTFFIFTKRIDRFTIALPNDWGEGYPNVIVACTTENQDRANYRLPIFQQLPIQHKVIAAAPLLEAIDLRPYLNEQIREVAVSGESGTISRICHYDWVLDIRQQCLEKNIPFCYHHTGARLLKDGRLYRIPSRLQWAQARKANINYRTLPNELWENRDNLSKLFS